jgi:hypothetical protein
MQSVAVPPVPPLPGDPKTPNADKNGVGARQDKIWTPLSFLDPIPLYKPMSGVAHDWLQSGVDHFEQW